MLGFLWWLWDGAITWVPKPLTATGASEIVATNRAQLVEIERTQHVVEIDGGVICWIENRQVLAIGEPKGSRI